MRAARTPHVYALPEPVRSRILADLRSCDHPHGGDPLCALCGAFPSRVALAREIARREAA